MVSLINPARNDAPRWTWHGKPTHVWLIGESNEEATLRDPYDQVLVRARRGRIGKRRGTWKVWHEDDGRLIAEGLHTLDDVRRTVDPR